MVPLYTERPLFGINIFITSTEIVIRRIKNKTRKQIHRISKAATATALPGLGGAGDMRP